MNNKTLIIGIIALALVGGALVLGGQLGKKDQNQTNQPAQNQTGDTGGAPITEEITTVNLTSSGFEPQRIEVKVGTRVSWVNKSGKAGTVNSADHPTHQKYVPLNLGEFPNESSVQLVFDKAGTYNYHNHLAPNQRGTVVVK
jgi:plastocyanin